MSPLDQMSADAEEYINFMLLREPGATGLPPTFIFITPDGKRGIINSVMNMDSGQKKQLLNDRAGNMMREKGAVAYVFISEAWTKRHDPSETPPDSIADDPARIEIVFFVAGDAHGEQRMKIWRIKRGEGETIIALDPMGEQTEMVGRFVNLLAQKKGDRTC